MTNVVGYDIAPQTGQGLVLERGQYIRLIDVQGAQVADVFARSASQPQMYLSPGHTRTRTGRLFPRVGQKFYMQNYQPILELVEDNSPGCHDMFYPSCDLHMYKWLQASADHPNCQSNFVAAAAELGWRPAQIPDPVNFFQNTPATGDGELLIQSARSKAGDNVVCRALIDLLFVVTACAQDLAPINGDQCTGLRLEVSQEQHHGSSIDAQN